MSNVFPVFLSITTPARPTVAVFEHEGKTERMPVHAWAIRKARLDEDEGGPAIDYTTVVGLVEGDDGELWAVDDDQFSWQFVTYETR